jgi:negative elongation factor C/D
VQTRHILFLLQVLDIIAPPYSDEFIDLFLPVVQNEEITGSLRNAEKNDDVSTFIGRIFRSENTVPFL